MEYEIIKDHATNRSRGFGFIVFDAEKTVDELLAKKGNMIDLNGSQVRHHSVFELCKSTFCTVKPAQGNKLRYSRAHTLLCLLFQLL